MSYHLISHVDWRKHLVKAIHIMYPLSLFIICNEFYATKRDGLRPHFLWLYIQPFPVTNQSIIHCLQYQKSLYHKSKVATLSICCVLIHTKQQHTHTHTRNVLWILIIISLLFDVDRLLCFHFTHSPKHTNTNTHSLYDQYILLDLYIATQITQVIKL